MTATLEASTCEASDTNCPAVVSIDAAVAKVTAAPIVDIKLDEAFELRTMRDEQGNERVFKVLVIDRPEKWVPSSTISIAYNLPQLGTNKAKRFKFTGLSLTEWDEIESMHIIPQWQGEGKPAAEFEREQSRMASEKMAHVLEASLRYKIPGESWADKATWIEKMNPGEMTALYMAAQYEACSFRDGGILDAYSLLASKANSQVEEFTGFEGLNDASKGEYFFRMQRPGDDYILEFQLKGISAKQREEIETECKEPEPPKSPKRDPITRKLDFQNMTPNLQDKQYLDRLRVVNRRRTIMFFNACLPFEIPGTTVTEQFEWLGNRLVGDVVRLKNFITEELTSYYSRYRFL